MRIYHGKEKLRGGVWEEDVKGRGIRSEHLERRRGGHVMVVVRMSALLDQAFQSPDPKSPGYGPYADDEEKVTYSWSGYRSVISFFTNASTSSKHQRHFFSLIVQTLIVRPGSAPSPFPDLATLVGASATTEGTVPRLCNYDERT
jgi:hypothetical protein